MMIRAGRERRKRMNWSIMRGLRRERHVLDNVDWESPLRRGWSLRKNRIWIFWDSVEETESLGGKNKGFLMEIWVHVRWELIQLTWGSQLRVWSRRLPSAVQRVGKGWWVWSGVAEHQLEQMRMAWKYHQLLISSKLPTSVIQIHTGKARTLVVDLSMHLVEELRKPKEDLVGV